MRIVKTFLITVFAVAAIGIAVNVFAHGSMGWSGGWGHHGTGWHHRGGYGPGYGDQLTADEYKQVEQKREAFFKETQQLRANLYEKERELQNELAKDKPDTSNASGLQKEISALQAQFDQQRIGHMIEMRKLHPNVERGLMTGAPMMGYGSYGVGPCW